MALVLAQVHLEYILYRVKRASCHLVQPLVGLTVKTHAYITLIANHLTLLVTDAVLGTLATAGKPAALLVVFLAVLFAIHVLEDALVEAITRGAAGEDFLDFEVARGRTKDGTWREH